MSAPKPSGRKPWEDKDEILRQYEREIREADELGLTRLSGTIPAEVHRAKKQ